MVTFESRMASNMCDLIEKKGGVPISAPSMQEVPWEKNRDVFSFAEKLLAGELDAVIFLTGVGTRFLFSILTDYLNKTNVGNGLTEGEARQVLWRRERSLQSLFKDVLVVARGPKPVRVLKELGVPITIIVPEPNTWRDILEALDESEKSISLQGKTVAIQEYGKPNQALADGLSERGAKVVRVPVYRWVLPDDTKPLQSAVREIINGNVDVALFTSAAQIDHVFRMATEMGVTDDLKKAFGKMVISSIGPICSEAIVSYGLRVDIQPEHNKMGHLILETAEQAPKILEQKKNQENLECGLSMIAKKQRFGDDPKRDRPLGVESVFLKACRLENVPYTPVWLMRQAGRYMKEYRDLREKVPFVELCKNKDLAAEITVAAQEKIKADAAIIFSDILLIVEPFGLGLEYSKNDGPVIGDAIREEKKILRLPEIEPEESLGFVFDAIREARARLKPNIPLIGFSGAPFTLASYMIEGGASKNFQHTKTLMYSNETLWHALMGKIARAVSKYLIAQINAGVQAVQLFDSWVGCLSPEDYEKYVLPYSQQVIDSIETGLHQKDKDLSLKQRIPLIHFGTNTGSFLELMAKAGGDVIGVDFRVQLDEAWQRIGHDRAIQGNLDPAILLGPIDKIRPRVKSILDQAGSRPGHIFNLGHGVLPETPVENVIALVEMVHEFSMKQKISTTDTGKARRLT